MVNKGGRIILSVLIIAAVFIIFFSLYFVIAQETNTKVYDGATRTVTVKNGATEVAKIKLNTPLVHNVIDRGDGVEQLVAEFTIDNNGAYSDAFNDMGFYDVKNSMNPINREFTYKYKTSDSVEVDVFEETCDDSLVNTNGTSWIKKVNCTNTKIGTRLQEVNVQWNDLDMASALPSGVTTIGVFTDVYPNEGVEWIPTMFDVRIDEWAVWTEGLNNGLVAYFNGEKNSSGELVDNVGGLMNASENVGTITNTTGIIGDAWSTDGTNDDMIKFTPNQTLLPDYFDLGINHTISFWFYGNSFGGTSEFLFTGHNSINKAYVWWVQANGQIRFGYNETYRTSPFWPNDGEWYNLVLSHNDTSLSVYVNGVFNSTSTLVQSFPIKGLIEDPHVDHAFRLMSSTNAGSPDLGLDGKMDELAFWNRTLSESEISDLYNGGSGITYNPNPSNVPSIPSLLLPSNNSGFEMFSTVTFVWDNSTDNDGDAITYDIEIYNETSLDSANLIHSNTSITEGSENTSISIKLSDYTTQDDDYYWRVRANDSTLASNWSKTRHFEYANWTITFNLTDSITGAQINDNTIDVVCDNGLNINNQANPYTATDFGVGVIECDFSDVVDHFDKSITITVDADETIEISMSAKEGLTQEEHGWLEELYDCVINGNCAAYDLWNNTWKRVSKTDRAVVTQEDFLSNTLNTNSNITLNYTIDVPYKAGYNNGEYLPLRLFFWFTNISNNACYNQDKATDTNRAEDPYCFPLVAETLGPNNGSVTFTVDLRPSLSDGNYNITRAIEIDPIINGEQVWTNYGQEDIGQISVEESNEEPSINFETTKEEFPESSASAIISSITGAVIGTGLFSSSGIFIVLIICLTLIIVVAITSRTILKLKEKTYLKKN